MTALITVQNVAKRFADRTVLSEVSLAVAQGDRIAFIGVNGSGKSTLLRLIAAACVGGEPGDAVDEGLITKRRGLTFQYVPQEPRLAPELAIEVVLRHGLAQRPNAAHDATDGAPELHRLVAGLGLPPLSALVSALSIGERRRVAIAAALLARPEVLALDEPTNHLDTHTVAWLQEQLLGLPGALLLVTHDRYFLDGVATRIIEIDRGRAYGYDGGYTRFLELQAERLDTQSERARVQRSFVRRELEWIRRGPAARTTKQQARIDRFDATVAQLSSTDHVRPDERVARLRLPPGPRLGKTVLEARGLTKSLGGKLLFQDLNLLMKPGDRIGIVGPNGAGKTTLVHTLLGELQADSGELVVGQNTQFAFLDQGRADLRDEDSVLEAIGGENDHVQLAEGPVHVRTFMRALLFDDRTAEVRVGKLSGGERNRVQLASLLRQGGNVLVLDEPTNDLDLLTLGVLEEALCEFPGCALVVSHDRWFLDRVATAILAFEQDGKVTLYEGNYSSYLSKWSARARSSAPAAVKEPTSNVGRAANTPGKKLKLSFKEQRELDGMAAAIELAEAEIAAAEEQLAAPDVYAKRGAEVPGLVAALEAARARTEQLYARWQELEALQSTLAK